MGIRKAPSHNAPRSGSDAEAHEILKERRRTARFRDEDDRYRKALGLCRGERIPARLGQCQRTGAARDSVRVAGCSTQQGAEVV